jgi:transposase InsO family protein
MDALGAFHFRVTHMLIDLGSYFTADAFEAACERHGVQRRKPHSYTPGIDAMVERFDGRVQPEVLGSWRQSSGSRRSARRAPLGAPAPCGPPVRGPREKTVGFASSWLHPRKSWGLRETRGGSEQPGCAM